MKERIVTSSGASEVTVKKNSVVQKYNADAHDRVMRTLNVLLVKPMVTCEIKVKAGYGRRAVCQSDFVEKFTYDIFDYLVRPVGFPDDSSIEFERIIPLIEHDSRYQGHVVWKEIPGERVKMLWNIGLALYGLHQKGIIHGDATLDNAGFRASDGHYVMYDFDSTRAINDDTQLLDFGTIAKSLEFHANRVSSIGNLSNFLVEVIKSAKIELGFETCHEAFLHLIHS